MRNALAVIAVVMTIGSTNVHAGLLEATLNTILVAQNKAISAEDAAKRAKKQYGGKVLSTRLVEPDDEPAYFRVKLIADGTVRVVRIDREQ